MNKQCTIEMERQGRILATRDPKGHKDVSQELISHPLWLLSLYEGRTMDDGRWPNISKTNHGNKDRACCELV